jgi:hypothetical protein
VTSTKPIVVWAVDFDQDAVWLKNISASSVSWSGADFCIPFDYTSTFNRTFAPGEIVKVCLDDADVPADCDLSMNGASSAWDLDAVAEFSVFDVAAGHQNSGLHAYLRWGAGAGTGRQSQATALSLWTVGATVTVTSGHRGLVAVGDVATAAGYQSVPSVEDCCGL